MNTPRSLSALPARSTKGTPAQRSLLIVSLQAAKVGVLLPAGAGWGGMGWFVVRCDVALCFELRSGRLVDLHSSCVRKQAPPETNPQPTQAL